MPNVIENILLKTGLKDRANATVDQIPSGATNITIGASFVVAVGAVAEQFSDWTKVFLGDNPTPTLRTAFAIAIIGALAIVYAADLLARAYATAHSTATDSPDRGREAKKASGGTAPMTGATVSIPDLPAQDESGWSILQCEGDKILVIKQGATPKWHTLSKIRGD